MAFKVLFVFAMGLFVALTTASPVRNEIPSEAMHEAPFPQERLPFDAFRKTKPKAEVKDKKSYGFYGFGGYGFPYGGYGGYYPGGYYY